MRHCLPSRATALLLATVGCVSDKAPQPGGAVDTGVALLDDGTGDVGSDSADAGGGAGGDTSGGDGGSGSGDEGSIDCSAERANLGNVYWPEVGPELCADGVPKSVGALWVGPDDSITNLAGLECVCSVSTRMRIEYVPALTSLRGLEQLDQPPAIFEVVDAPALTSLDHLGGHRSRYEHLYLMRVEALASLAFLSGTESIENFFVGPAPALTSLEGLESLSSVGSFQLDGTGIAHVDELSGMTRAGGLSFEENHSLTNLSGLANVTELADLSLIRNGALENVGAFTDIEESSSLVVKGSPLLTTLDGPRTVTDRLELWQVPALTDLGTLEVSSALNYVYVGETGLAHLDVLEGLRTAGELYVVSNPHLASIAGLSGLTAVDGHLRVVSNPMLSQCHAEEILVAGLGEAAVGGDFQVDYNGECGAE